jgi:hypothetical protein
MVFTPPQCTCKKLFTCDQGEFVNVKDLVGMIYIYLFLHNKYMCIYTCHPNIVPNNASNKVKWNEREIQIKNPTNVNQHSSMPFTLMCTWKSICYFTHLNKNWIWCPCIEEKAIV